MWIRGPEKFNSKKENKVQQTPVSCLGRELDVLHIMRYFSLTETVLLSMLFSLREGGGLFILFYFILPFGLMLTFGNEKNIYK